MQCQLPTSRSVVKVELDRSIVSGLIERNVKVIPGREKKKRNTHTYTYRLLYEFLRWQRQESTHATITWAMVNSNRK